ncbi:hypothetical protein IGB42_00338 [Andreprevotia sp. IGB-42]|uniref:hypothetical protein n=1 Tax=Andreprevotia sp. IGB-42 TaxID=2497473 RepID=UPI00135AADF2|nr:hypothetical protein [Andreprevotia sp. IGB-42]KAF0815257.1 hypothetical protein IGB42_00338 [Andreprevotia sp. IGB-42]
MLDMHESKLQIRVEYIRNGMPGHRDTEIAAGYSKPEQAMQVLLGTYATLQSRDSVDTHGSNVRELAGELGFSCFAYVAKAGNRVETVVVV